MGDFPYYPADYVWRNVQAKEKAVELYAKYIVGSCRARNKRSPGFQKAHRRMYAELATFIEQGLISQPPLCIRKEDFDGETWQEGE